MAPFINAARKQGIELFLLSSRSVLGLPSDVPGTTFDAASFDIARNTVLEVALNEHRQRPFNGIIATDDATTHLAAAVAPSLSLKCNTKESVQLTRDKLMGRKRLKSAGLPCPEFICLDARTACTSSATVNDNLLSTDNLPAFPLVVKPLSLSASRGVIRVDNRGDLETALRRIARLLEKEFIDPDYRVLVESYIPGFEVAVEGLLLNGKLHTLAVFDKPEPLTGPYFEETFYTTPSRLSNDILDQLIQRIGEVLDAFGLSEGPIHAECRINDAGIWLVEVASRTIGGRCGQLLELATGLSLEDIVISHALGEEPMIRPISGGAGVLMVPVPSSGVVRRVEGISDARRVANVVAVDLDVSTGQVLQAWPEGGSYPGFIFSCAGNAHDAEMALRRAHQAIRIIVAPLLESGLKASEGRQDKANGRENAQIT
ncbi:MAG: phosphoribosylglycinamide synthetase [marine bacterium B5-7]|nr:MAG: phosphoribosylglycinamide synthetase [marine bacterium B5-7]